MPYTPNLTVLAAGPAGPQPGHFGNVAGGSVGQTYVSALDYYQPFELVEIFARHNLRPTFVDWIGVYGSRSYSSNPKVGQYEKGPGEAYLRFGAVALAAAGVMTVTLDATIMKDDSLTIGGAARQSSPGRVGEQIMVGSNAIYRIQSKNISVTPHTMVLEPINTTANATIDLQVLEDTNYAIVNNAFGEGTKGMTGALPQLIKYSNDFQIVKEAVGATGSSLTNRTIFNPIKGVPGNFFMLADWETMHRFNRRKSGALLMGQPGDGSVVVLSDQLGYDVPVTQTEGLENFARTGGLNATYTDGSLALDDLRAISRYLEVNAIGAGEVCGWLGYDVYEGLEKAAVTFLDATADAFVMQQRITSGLDYTAADESPLDAQALALNLGFRSVRIGGTNYSWYMLHEFNSATGLGMATYDYTKTGIFHPMTNVTNYLNNTQDPIISVVYKELNGYSREHVISQVAGAGVGGAGGYLPLASHDTDGLNVYFTSELAFHGTTANRFIYFAPA